MQRYLGGLLLLAPLACDRLTLPEGAELASLDAAYDDPQGTVDESTIADLAATALRQLDTILGLGRLEFVSESLTEVSEVVKETVKSDGDTRFHVKALTSVERLCPGESGASGEGGEGGAVNPDNGVLTYTMRVRENGILDTVWGEFSDCSFPDPGEIFPGVSILPRTPGSIITYDGSMDIYLGGELQLADLTFESFLFRLEGTLDLENGGDDIPVEVDFRVYQDHRTEVRAPGEGGDVVFTFTPGTTLVGLATGDGSYCCQFSARTCVLSEGDSCEDLQPGDRVLTW